MSHHGQTRDEYAARFKEYRERGYRLVQVNPYATPNGAEKYVSIWEVSDGPDWAQIRNMNATTYEQTLRSYRQMGYRLIHVAGYEIDDQAFYAAIWEKSSGPERVEKHGLSLRDFRIESSVLSSQGFDPIVLNGFSIKGNAYYTALFERRDDSRANHFMVEEYLTSEQYSSHFKNLRYQRYRPRIVAGYSLEERSYYAYIYENTRFDKKYLTYIHKEINGFLGATAGGLSLAIMKEDRLVYCAGFGTADESSFEPVNPDHRFRIASVSKPMTAIGIMRLVEQKKLKLTDKVFGRGSVLGNTFGTLPYSSRERDITVAHLLEHTSGFTSDSDEDDGFDHGFTDPGGENRGRNQKELIDAVLDGADPVTPPGTRYKYENFGFLLLGRIIEAKTGMSYEKYMQEEIFRRANVSTMEIAGNTRNDRKRDEVVYYQSGGDDTPYTFNIARRDSHGGWIARPRDLLAVATLVDHVPGRPKILSPAIREMMFQIPAGVNSTYAKGWQVTSIAQFHSGSSPGVRSRLNVRNTTDIAWSVTLNNGDFNASQIFNLVNGIIRNTGDNWPTGDLFD